MAQLTKHKWLIAIAAAVIIVLAVIWIALSQASKPDRVLEKFENAVKIKDTKQLEGLIVADNPNALVNNISLQAMIRYLKTNANSYQVIRDDIHNQSGWIRKQCMGEQKRTETKKCPRPEMGPERR
ncbi:hypothetical protein L3V65_10710 [Heyndrickxia coagulans]|jgi:uncharacterized membrane protein YvbJ|uniref:TcaA second domain-containing protein n=1 Tax=Heyndrickxia coagulans TaxID=1398 RepID=UPI001F317952|nr:hypothetical protein [Heyndrickxia coagulans]UJZ86753.1 hypothetical protein L3V65_10710 [Heyndrickxia coagulans]